MALKEIDYTPIIKVIIVNFGGLMIGFSDVSEILKIISLLIAIVYTSWKFYTDFQDKKKEK